MSDYGLRVGANACTPTIRSGAAKVAAYVNTAGRRFASSAGENPTSNGGMGSVAVPRECHVCEVERPAAFPDHARPSPSSAIPA